MRERARASVRMEFMHVWMMDGADLEAT